jgi:hypothetical protein
MELFPSFLNTFTADASHLDVCRFNLAERPYRIRQSDVIKIIAGEVTRESALPANEMMVTLEIGVETGASKARTQRYDQSKIIQQPECPVDGIKRDCRYALPDTLENLVGIRVISCLSNLTEDFYALMRQLDSFVTANRLEMFHALFYFIFLDLHIHALVKNRFLFAY